MNIKMKERKEKEVNANTSLKYAIKIERPPVRPPTPSIEIPYHLD
jgi:hypothetical protein